jgi:SAM-dependent methyltransferase/predicted RNA-binding Zn-ribbon protein involved in translation (DUF1610 family)
MNLIAEFDIVNNREIAPEEFDNKQKAELSCPLCSANRCSEIYSNPLIYRCQKCGHAFRTQNDPRVISGYVGKVKMPEIIVAKYFADFYYRLIDKHIGFNRIDSLLEIGSGDGVLLARIRKYNPLTKITAIEPSRYHCEHLKRIPNIDVINDYIENAYPNYRYDLIIMSHVLEHIPDPKSALEDIASRFLNPGGHLLIGVPSGEFELYNRQTAAIAPSGHLHFFNGGSLLELLKTAKFNIDSALGFKIKTIPANYHEIANCIARYSNSKKPLDIFLKYYYKAIRRILTFAKVSMLFLFRVGPDRQPLDSPVGCFNNIVIIVKK